MGLQSPNKGCAKSIILKFFETFRNNAYLRLFKYNNNPIKYNENSMMTDTSKKHDCNTVPASLNFGAIKCLN